ncbi:hypothetical protein [Halalkalicoccus jeotgali]|uniref:Uncharacterized protein n=1 Tax=Halalkalicoccus jeotgali (strain DSM 18796 / CECT 7217 / JCM 14584 / KCTC 4019 / B3) TaxID=795797 RepID=D8JBG7_HALJB|nr:hypothetical protein [Halalkalicoccus jeotgali]ADJ16620.1 hypothetical protein HacjB3_16321 [Halalkalicoccus jeotgali B3]ELY41283.1 hypothetical protein C497_00925 [Halalkalicoccus jeotgali B3]
MSSEIDESNIDKDVDVGTANTMRERAGESRIKLWILLSANRLVVTGVLTLAMFLVFVVAVTVLPPPLIPQLSSGDTIETLFSTMITVVVTGTTLVVTIGQLVISQENGPLGEQRGRMEDSMDFRDYTEELIGAPSPADPSAFLRNLIDVSQDRAEAVRDGLSDIESDQLRWEVDQFTDSLIGNSEVVRDELEGAQFGTFDVMHAALDYNYGWKIFQVERLLHDHQEDLGQPENDLLNELKVALSMFGPAREHVKTLYFEWALITLSQLILYAAIPALAVAGIMVTVVDATTLVGSTLGIENITWLIGAAFAVTLIPFFLFTAYVSRVVTVAKRTLAIEPLILRESQR